MKVLIMSDSHGRNANMRNIMGKVPPIDALIHLGDLEGSEEYVRSLADCPVHMVSGNNDYGADLPKDEELWLGGHHVFITHGHRYGVYVGTDKLKAAARSRGAEIVMFGHTHRPLLEREADLTTLNPGSISLPRQEGHRCSYMVMEVDRKGELHFTVNYL